jgi:hypothetical protein
MKSLDAFRLIVLSGIVVTVLVTGCSENECPEPYCCIPDPALDNIWPNRDKLAWTYEYLCRTWDSPGPTVYDDIDSVPPAPTMDEVVELLADHPIGDNPDSIRGDYRLKFDGDITTAAGVTAQNLTEMLITDDGVGFPEGRHVGPYGYLRSASLDTFITVSILPGFLHGGAWEKTDEWIATYVEEGDYDTLPNWKFLDADLEVGHEFTHELTLGDGVLSCRILRQTEFETQAGIFEKAIECLYLFDPGILAYTTEYDTTGWARPFEYGVVVYAPTVGPVYCYRRMYIDPGDPPGPGAGEVTVDLMAATTIGDLALKPGAGAK